MTMRWGMVLLGSFVGGGIVLGVLLYRKQKELTVRGEFLRQQLESEDGQALIALQLEQMKTDLATHAEAVATRAADDHIGAVYGLPPARIQAIQQLATRLGA